MSSIKTKKASTLNDMSQSSLRKLIESLDDDDDLDKLGKEDFFFAFRLLF